MRCKNEVLKIVVKNSACYYFDDTINGTIINFSNILLDKKLFENISVFNTLYKSLAGPKPLGIRLDKIDGFIISLDGKIKHLTLFDYGFFNKICNKIKKQINIDRITKVLIILLKWSEMIHIILYLLKKYWLFIML